MKKFLNIYFHGDRNSKKIALTFDDGPCEETTQILDILKEENAKATFFVWGEKIKGNEETIKRAVEQGCEIGNHTFNHFKLLLKGEKIIKEQIRKTDQELAKLNIKTNLFRPPNGFFSINFHTLKITKKQDKKIIMLDMWVTDWLKPGVEKITKTTLKKVKNGSIIVLHEYIQDSGRNPDIIPALKMIIPKLKKRGYKLVTVSELLDF